MTSRFAIAKSRALDDLDGIVVDLVGGSTKYRRGGQWNVRNPFRPGSKESQMVIWLRGARRGGWCDFVSGEKGDVIDLVALGLEGAVNAETRMRAVEWLEDRYGLKDLSPETRKRIDAEAKTRKVVMEAKEVKRRETNLTRARKMFFAAQGGITGTLAETYLASRGIALGAVEHLVENTFRFSPAFEYWLDAARPRLPAMLAAMVSEKGKIGACHITYLAADGRAKADVEKAKLMWPETAGMMIRVTQGRAGLPLEAAPERSGLLGVTEGIEDALSAAVADPDLRMWAAGSLSGLLYVPDHPAVSGYLIFQDNDWGKPQAKRLFNRAVGRIRGFGKPVEVIAMSAEWGKDVNDALRGAGDVVAGQISPVD